MLICRPSRMVQATYVSLGLASGTADAMYTLACLVDPRNPAKGLWLIDSPVVAVRIVWDHGTPLRIDGVSLAKHNFDANLDVRVQRHTANAWDAPTQDAGLLIAAPHEDGHSTSPWVDLRDEDGYDEDGFRYTSLYIPVNSVAPKLAGLVFVEQFEATEPHIGPTLTRGERRPFIWSLQTEADARRYYSRRLKQRILRGPGMPSAAEMAIWRAINRETDGPVRPFLFIFDETLKTDDALLVRYSDATAEALEWDDSHPVVKPITLEFDEVSRGLPSF